MKINNKVKIYTHEGSPAKQISIEQQLRRSLMCCMLWEDSFYESGESIATRISKLADQCDLETLSKLAIESRTVFKLRHAPLLILLSMIKRGTSITAKTIEEVINRPDEITELVALYWKDGKKTITRQMRVGLSKAFLKFNEYQLAKWNRDGAVKLRDVLFLVHAKPSKDKEVLFKRIAEKKLEIPNTWESRLASGQNKKEVFEDLLRTNKLGYMALLKNLRGMNEAGVSHDLIIDAIKKPSASVLPFRFVSAAKHAPMFERYLDDAMLKLLDNKEQIKGHTVLMVDVSGSMGPMSGTISKKSDLLRIDAACALAMLLSGICEHIRILTFSDSLVEVPARKGMALRDTILHSQPHSGTDLGKAVSVVMKNLKYDRMIVISDEQSSTRVPDPKGLAYMLNVASCQNGVGYGSWVHIDGFSEACVDFIQEHERSIN